MHVNAVHIQQVTRLNVTLRTDDTLQLEFIEAGKTAAVVTLTPLEGATNRDLLHLVRHSLDDTLLKALQTERK